MLILFFLVTKSLQKTLVNYSDLCYPEKKQILKKILNLLKKRGHYGKRNV